MSSVAVDLLNRPAGEAAALVALHHLDAAAAAAARLTDRTDAEALHDFRVAVRRLRVTLRAYPALQRGVAKKQRRRLRKLVSETNAVRDAEAQIAWFRDHTGQFTPSQRAALGALRSRLRARRRRARVHTHQELQRRFAKVERKIRHAAAALPADRGAHETVVPFRAIAAATLLKYAMDLRKRLERTTEPSATDLHTSRIAAKRLRYVLEPIEQDLVNGARLIARLRQLQDVFGRLTDAHELQAELQRAAMTDRKVGVTAAMTLLEAEAGGLLATLRAEWSTAGRELEQDVVAAVRQLSPPRRATPRRPRPVRPESRVPA